MSESKPAIVQKFLKFGTLENLLKLRAGQVHMKTLGYFRDLEEKDGRGDSYEALTTHLQPGQFRLGFRTSTSDEIFEVTELIAKPLRIWANTDVHVFCMTALTVQYLEEQARVGAPIIGERLKALSNYVLEISPKPFMDRMTQAAAAAGFKTDWGVVKYYNPALYHGEIDYFDKRSSYDWQMEARIVADPSGNDHMNIELGSLEDISILKTFANPKA